MAHWTETKADKRERRVTAWGMGLTYVLIFLAVQATVSLLLICGLIGRAVARHGWNVLKSQAYLSSLIKPFTAGSWLGWLTIIADVAIFFVVMFIVKCQRKGFRKTVNLQRFKPGLILPLLGIGLGIGLLLESLGILVSPFVSLSAATNGTAQKFLSLYPTVSGLLGLAVVAPIVEETVFRGLIFNTFRKKLALPAALIIQAIIFGAAHGNIPQFISAFGLGCLLGWVFSRTKSIGCSMLVHGSYNLAIALSVLLAIFNKTARAWGAAHAGYWIGGSFLLAVIAAALLIFGLLRLVSLTRKPGSSRAQLAAQQRQAQQQWLQWQQWQMQQQQWQWQMQQQQWQQWWQQHPQAQAQGQGQPQWWSPSPSPSPGPGSRPSPAGTLPPA